MLKFNQFKQDLEESTPLPQNHDINGIGRDFPELKKKKSSCSLNNKKKCTAKKPHDVQKSSRRVTGLMADPSELPTQRAITEDKSHYTVVGRFGEKKYKNIKQAQRTASVPHRVTMGDPETKYTPNKVYYTSQKRLSTVGEPIKKFGEFIKTVTPSSSKRKSKTPQTKSSDFYKSNPPAKQEIKPTEPVKTAGEVSRGYTQEPEIKKPKVTKTTTPKPRNQRTAGSVLSEIS